MVKQEITAIYQVTKTEKLVMQLYKADDMMLLRFLKTGEPYGMSLYDAKQLLNYIRQMEKTKDVPETFRILVAKRDSETEECSIPWKDLREFLYEHLEEINDDNHA